jgi:ribokinase
MKTVYCVGLLVCDVPLRPVPSSIFSQVRSYIDAPVWGIGGDAANVAVTLSKLGVKANFSSMIGKDMYGEFLVRCLREAGVDTRGLKEHPSLGTGISHILIEPEGERHFLVYRDLFNAMDYSMVSEELIAESDIVYFGSLMSLEAMDAGGTAELFKKARSLGKITAVDFKGNEEIRGDYWIKLLDPVLRNCDILMPSLGEAVVLTQKRELPAIREALSGYGIKTLIVKLGARGCYLTDFKDEWMIPTFSEFKVKDTTGAGDSFVAGFIRGILEGWDNQTAARFACCVASHNVAKVGATAGIPDFDTACRYMKEHKPPK